MTRSNEEATRLDEESRHIKDDLAQRLKDYDQIRGSTPWGNGEGSDQAKFDRAVSEFTPHREYTFSTDISTPEGQNLSQALNYRNWAAEQLDQSADGFGKKAFAVAAADHTLKIADESYGHGETVEGDFAVEAAKSMLVSPLALRLELAGARTSLKPSRVRTLSPATTSTCLNAQWLFLVLSP